MRFDAVESALDELQAHAKQLADAAARNPADTKLRRYGPEQQVVARLELAGPERRLSSMHAGIDVHGDGSTKTYTGRVRRRAIEPAPGEDAIAALRRTLSSA